MPDRIPWDRYDGDAVENIVAIFLLRLHKHGERRKPSRGDKGIDILVRNEDNSWTVYQVKRYTKPLTSKHKSEIAESWRRLHEYSMGRELRIREWIVVRPRDATIEDTDWLEGLTAPANITSQWLGEANLDAWATRFPEVVDYYLKGGQERALEIALQLFKAARLERDNNDGLDYTLADAQDGLNAVFAAANRSDPHFSYEFSIGADRETEKQRYPLDPDLVWTSDVIQKGVKVRTNVFRRYDLAEEDSPIDLSLNIVFRPNGEDQERELEAFIEFGMPLEEMPAKISGDAPGLGMVQSDSAAISILAPKEGIKSGQYTLSVRDGDGKGTSGTVQMEGMVSAAKGWSWTGRIGGRVEFTAFGAFDESQYGLRINPFTVEALPPHDAQLALSLQATLALSGDIRLNVPHGPSVLEMSTTGDTAGDERIRQLRFATQIVEALSIIQEYSTESIKVPKVQTSLPGDIRRWIQVAELLQHGERTTTWDDVVLNVDEPGANPPAMPSEIYTVARIKVHIGGEWLQVGHSIQTGIAESFISGTDGQITLMPGKNNKLLEQVTTDPEQIKLANRVFLRPILGDGGSTDGLL